MNKLLLLFFLFINLTLSAKVLVQTEHINIIRDHWGVPHISAPTDEEVAYGLAWAEAEDDFESMQENLLTTHQLLASIKGKDGAVLDFISAFLGINELVTPERIDTSFSPKFKRVLEFYCQGVNDYAQKHPMEILHKKIFPISVADVIKGYTFNMALMTNVHYDIIKILGGNFTNEDLQAPKGSNGIIVGSNRTSNHKTFLAINSHQPLSGPLSWYEVHLHSAEGWNMLGGTFPGGVTIFHGVNDSLGWAHTVSFADMDDIYQLRMHPTQSLTYQFNGKWLKLQKKRVWLKIKWWIFTIPFPKTFYTSIYGPTLRSKDGHFYSIRYSSAMSINAAEQWYRMNKSHNFNEFYQALRMQGIKGLNILYADSKQNIFYLDNACLPMRNPQYDWWKILPGDTSATLWSIKKQVPLEQLYQIKNPNCGFLFNTNNSPFFSTGYTCQKEYTDSTLHNSYFQFNNNRSLRLYDLLQSKKVISYNDFKKIKFDQHFRSPAYTYSMANIEGLFKLSADKFPDLRAIIHIMQAWDRNADINSYGATIANLFSTMYLHDYISKNGLPTHEVCLDEQVTVHYLRKVKMHLEKYFGTVYVPLGDFQKLVRGNRALPVSGIMDVIAAMWITPYKNGRYKAQSGESYIMLVQWDKNGPAIETISPYGSSNHPNSPHYDDQMALYVKHKLKPMSLQLPQGNEVERRYHPNS